MRRRASEAPQTLDPGLLSSSVPGGGAYVSGAASVGGAASSLSGWVLAADLGGHVSALSLGSPATLPERVWDMERSHRLVVADLPEGGLGAADLRGLLLSRPRSELVIVLERRGAGTSDDLAWVGIAGLGARRTLTSATTEQSGIVAAIDLAPTILSYLRQPIPGAMHGARIEATGKLDLAALRRTMARLNAIEGRRMPAMAWLLGAVIALVLLCLRARRAWALRVGSLALLWAPAATLMTAALEPSAMAEYAILTGVCLGLGALCDLMPWPRALLAPALVTVAAVTIDALAGTQLLMRSLLGPNPAFGARFHGIGNELKPVLAVMALAATAAAVYPARDRRLAATAMAVVGVALAGVEGSTLIGAGVGGAMLVAAGATVATVALLSAGRSSRALCSPRRRWRMGALVIGAPLIALLTLAMLDIATANGTGQLSVSVLHASSMAELWDIVMRRYGAAWIELRHGTVPYATALAVVACAFGIRHRERLLAATGADAGFAAALTGGLAAGIVGTLVEDSGPVLLVLSTLTLGCVLAYLSAPPRRASTTQTQRRSGGAVPAGAAQHDLML